MPSVMILFALWWSILRLQVSESWLSSPNIPMSLAGTCQKRHRGNSLPIGSKLTTPGTSCKVIPSFSHKEGISNVGSGFEGLTPNIMTENTTAVAFGLLVDTIEKWAVVIENRQDFSKEEIVDRLDEWMNKIDGDQRVLRWRLERIQKDFTRLTIFIVVCSGIALMTTVQAWLQVK